MAWFKCSSSFLNSPAMQEITRCGDMRSGLGYLRSMALIWIMTLSIENEGIRDVDTLFYYGIPRKQAELVWKECIARGILNKTETGFSAKLWMAKNGLIGKRNQKTNKSERDNAIPRRCEESKDQRKSPKSEVNQEASKRIVTGEELERYKERLASLAYR